MSRRGRYDFNSRTKDKAKADWHADHPDREDERLEVNHIVAVHYARKMGIPPDLVRTQDNAEALTIPDHLEHHRNEPTDEEYAVLARGLLGWIRNLF